MQARGATATGDHKPRRSAYDKALALLVRREHSRRELDARLVRDGYEREDIDDALDRLSDAHYQDDHRFADMLVRTRIGQGYGPMRLRAELKSHGVAADLIAELLEQAETETDWTALAAAQLQRRYGHEPAADYADRARRAQFLLRRGFDSTTARAAVDASRVDE